MSKERPRTLSAHEVDDIFLPGEITEPVAVTADAPVLGELIVDRTGAVFLTPVPDRRGGSGRAVPVRGLGEPAGLGFLGEIVAVSGTYDPETGFELDKVVLADEVD
ncbi:MAG: hypothetical protein ACR2PM_21140 [Hyphomicrobiales bacterium]